jgi:hypothetical protein
MTTAGDAPPPSVLPLMTADDPENGFRSCLLAATAVTCPDESDSARAWDRQAVSDARDSPLYENA